MESIRINTEGVSEWTKHFSSSSTIISDELQLIPTEDGISDLIMKAHHDIFELEKIRKTEAERLLYLIVENYEECESMLLYLNMEAFSCNIQ